MATEPARSDLFFMKRALVLARRGAGYVSPNPMVGAILVNDGDIVGQGWHRGVGLPHAESEALQEAGARARGGTLYVTLEPCNHHGRTPPCVQQIVSAGVKRVVVAMRDPNPTVPGGGVESLLAAGLAVELDVARPAAEELNRPWISSLRCNRPYVVVKLAASLDGKLGDPTVAGLVDQKRRWLSSPVSLAQVHRIRRSVDAVLVGTNTVVADNPSLTNRSGRGPQPSRVYLDAKLRVSLNSKLFVAGGQVEQQRPPIICFSSNDASHEREQKLAALGVVVVRVDRDSGSFGLNLVQVMNRLHGLGICSVLCEGGARLSSGLLAAGLCDRVVLYRAPRLIEGGEPVMPEILKLAGEQGLNVVLERRLGPDRVAIFERR